MYTVIILLLMGVLPVASILIEYVARPETFGFVALVGRWFVFWAVGVRLAMAGLKQATDPAYTAQMLGVTDQAVFVTIRELGFANLAIGAIGILSVVFPGWILPAAIAGALFLGLAGVNHVLRGAHTRNETIAMASDLAVALVLAVFIVATVAGA